VTQVEHRSVEVERLDHDVAGEQRRDRDVDDRALDERDTP
jgi:hypothetical protein